MRVGFQQSNGFQTSLMTKSAWGVGAGVCEPLATQQGPFGAAGKAYVNPAAGTGACLITDGTITLDAEATAGLLYMSQLPCRKQQGL